MQSNMNNTNNNTEFGRNDFDNYTNPLRDPVTTDETSRFDNNMSTGAGAAMTGGDQWDRGTGTNNMNSSTFGGQTEPGEFNQRTAMDPASGGVGYGAQDNWSSGNRTTDLGTGTGSGYHPSTAGAGTYHPTTGAGAGTGRTAAEFGSTGMKTHDNTTTGKPSTGDKLRGTAEELAGKVMNNPELRERGQERKTGGMNRDNF